MQKYAISFLDTKDAASLPSKMQHLSPQRRSIFTIGPLQSHHIKIHETRMSILVFLSRQRVILCKFNQFHKLKTNSNFLGDLFKFVHQTLSVIRASFFTQFLHFLHLTHKTLCVCTSEYRCLSYWSCHNRVYLINPLQIYILFLNCQYPLIKILHYHSVPPSIVKHPPKRAKRCCIFAVLK